MLLDEKNYLNDKKFNIKIIKNIPQQSGMGGGSINAASLLKSALSYLEINDT